MFDLQAALDYAKSHEEAALQDLIDLLRIPSISTLPEYQPDMQATAEWIAARLRKLNFTAVEVMPTGKHPIVYGELSSAGPDAPTVLLYGHYDVQPADPLELWTSEPFDPQIRGENLYARGASDMKGQLVAFLRALEAVQQYGSLPFNMKTLLEGEEEIGSPSLQSFLEANQDKFACDLCLNVDSGIQSASTPSLTYALRGLSYFEIRLQGPASDLHSGRFGGVVENPAMVLCKILAGMIDDEGRISLPGFYDPVRPLSAEERREFAELPIDDQWWQTQSGAPMLAGEVGYSATERAVARPTLDVNGFLSGFTGEGSKTVLPARAMAKLSMRLVPDQTPEMVEASLRQYLQEKMPGTVTWEIENLSDALPGIVERDSPAVSAAIAALEAVWGKKPLFVREGGTIPVVGMVQRFLGADTLMLGFGLPDDNLHAPNEKQHLPTFYRGIETFIRFASEFGG